jgi:hypothetical protein
MCVPLLLICRVVPEAGELPRRKHTTFRTRRKFEIKKKKRFFSRKTQLSDTNNVAHILCFLNGSVTFDNSIRFRMPYLLWQQHIPQTHMRKNKTMNIDDAIADDMLLRASACRPFQVSIGVKP